MTTSFAQSLIPKPQDRPLRIVLVTNFKDASQIAYALTARGIDVADVLECEPHVDYQPILTADPDVVLIMTELLSHSSWQRVMTFCRNHQIPCRTLSKKKASWGFLPLTNVSAPTDKPPSGEPMPPSAAVARLPVPVRPVEEAEDEESPPTASSPPDDQDRELLEMTLHENEGLRKEILKLGLRLKTVDAIVLLVEQRLLSETEAWAKLAQVRGS